MGYQFSLICHLDCIFGHIINALMEVVIYQNGILIKEFTILISMTKYKKNNQIYWLQSKRGIQSKEKWVMLELIGKHVGKCEKSSAKSIAAQGSHSIILHKMNLLNPRALKVSEYKHGLNGETPNHLHQSCTALCTPARWRAPDTLASP